MPRAATASDCHCECCVCDADVLVHARCGEVRRIPVTFENDSRRERQVKLELEKFVTAGGRELKWAAQLSDTEFTLKPCDEHTIIVVGAGALRSAQGRADDRHPRRRSEPPAGTIDAVGRQARPPSVWAASIAARWRTRRCAPKGARCGRPSSRWRCCPTTATTIGVRAAAAAATESTDVSQPADWGARFQELAADAGQIVRPVAAPLQRAARSRRRAAN